MDHRGESGEPAEKRPKRIDDPAKGPSTFTPDCLDEALSIIDRLSGTDSSRFSRIIEAQRLRGEMFIPDGLSGSVKRWFAKPGDDDAGVAALERARVQCTTFLYNHLTCEAALFNPARASRPVAAASGGDVVEAEIEAIRGMQSCDFCDPLNKTSSDTWGRVESSYCVTASNLAKFAGCHSVIILKEHHPLCWNRDVIAECLETAREWHRRSHEANPHCAYPLTFWNCLRKAGASQLHGHWQVALLPRFTGIQELTLRAARELWSSEKLDYFEELLWCHDQLNLSCRLGGAAAFAHAVARKDREVVVLTKGGDFSRDFVDLLYLALTVLVDGLGVRSFNLGVYTPSFVDRGDMPQYIVARIVDRGDPSKAGTDWAGIEMFAGPSVITTDPITIAKALQEAVRTYNKEGILPARPDKFQAMLSCMT